MRVAEHYLYQTFANMKARCLNPNSKSYKNYGGRGIKVCDRWMERGDGFYNFIKDMGERPPKHSIDRIDVDGDYCPENCRWADSKTQSNNKRPLGNRVNRTYYERNENFCIYLRKNRISKYRVQIRLKNFHTPSKCFKTLTEAMEYRDELFAQFYETKNNALKGKKCLTLTK